MKTLKLDPAEIRLPDPKDLKTYFFDISGDFPGNAWLIAGKEPFLLDTGMAYVGDQLVENIETVLRRLNELSASAPGSEIFGTEVEHVLLSHSHYDHIAGVPWVKEKWPDAKVYIAERGKMIMEKPSAREVMRGMTNAAAENFGVPAPDYDDNGLKADIALLDEDVLTFGDWQIKAIATPGHTKDCMAFLLNHEGSEKTVLAVDETAGAYMKSGHFTPCFLVSYLDSIASIDKMESFHADYLHFSHFGFANGLSNDELWKICRHDIYEAGLVIRTEALSGHDLETQLQNLTEYYWRPDVREHQPYKAYAANMTAMLKTMAATEI